MRFRPVFIVAADLFLCLLFFKKIEHPLFSFKPLITQTYCCILEFGPGCGPEKEYAYIIRIITTRLAGNGRRGKQGMAVWRQEARSKASFVEYFIKTFLILQLN
jgi:hypothetical protein